LPTSLFPGIGNDQTHEVLNILDLFGGRATRLGNQFRYNLVADENVVIPAMVKLFCNNGGEVEGYKVFFSIDDITRICPFSPAGQTDPDGNPIPRETWETWGTAGTRHAPVLIDGTYYRSNSVGASGEPLAASEWYTGWDTPPPGLGIISVSEFQQIVDDSSNGP
jgi:hypothetical protein